MTDKNPFKIGDRVKWDKRFLDMMLSMFGSEGTTWANPGVRGIVKGELNNYGNLPVQLFTPLNYATTEWQISPHNLIFAKD